MIIQEAGLSDLLVVLNDLRPEDQAEYSAVLADTPKGLAASRLFAAKPHCWVAHNDGGPVAFVATHRVVPHLCGISMAATPEFPSIALGLTKWIRRTLLPRMWRDGVHRGEARMVDGHPSAGPWMETLGAVHEAEMPLAGRNGETMHLYAWRASDPWWNDLKEGT